MVFEKMKNQNIRRETLKALPSEGKNTYNTVQDI
jgi:hypothetical protein